MSISNILKGLQRDEQDITSGGLTSPIHVWLGLSRETIIKRLRKIDETCGWTRASDYYALVERLAKIDEVPCNGHYYWGNLKEGKTPKFGMSAALEEGGLKSAMSYMDSLHNNTKGQDH